jgi:hypothetical protein
VLVDAVEETRWGTKPEVVVGGGVDVEVVITSGVEGGGVEVVITSGVEGGGVVADGSSVGVSSGCVGVGPGLVGGAVPQIQVHTGAVVVVIGGGGAVVVIGGGGAVVVAGAVVVGAGVGVVVFVKRWGVRSDVVGEVVAADVEGSRDVVEGSSVGDDAGGEDDDCGEDDDGGGDDVVLEVSRKGRKPEVPAVELVVGMMEVMVEVMVEEVVEEEMRNGVRPLEGVGGATVVLVERRKGIRPAVEAVVVVRLLSLKGKIPLGPAVVVRGSPCLLYLFLPSEAVTAGSQTGQLRPVSRQ